MSDVTRDKLRQDAKQNVEPDHLEELTVSDERLEAIALSRLPAEERERQLAAMDRPKRHRFERAFAKQKEREAKHGRTAVNKAHLAWAMGQYNNNFLMPLAVRLDAAEAFIAYLSLPFYRRWWVDLNRIVRREIPDAFRYALAWIEEHLGLRFVKNVSEYEEAHESAEEAA